MIAHMHTETWASMVGLDHMPRAGELIRVAPEGETDDHDGVYEVLRVMHTVGGGRVDFYAQRVADAGRKVGWSQVMGALSRTPLRRDQPEIADLIDGLVDERTALREFVSIIEADACYFVGNPEEGERRAAEALGTTGVSNPDAAAFSTQRAADAACAFSYEWCNTHQAVRSLDDRSRCTTAKSRDRSRGVGDAHPDHA